ncbi:acyltransferase family protein [Gorillibacterium massiliense]|uniref:acyltransferase family protein n=1 Tax=Gorillibacterium massiliense TaxID=1280390 RepID=UPI000594BB78|nr:acyltransferase [Gorillibacterium massiliense]
MKRFEELDSLRGLAAFSVFLHHALLMLLFTELGFSQMTLPQKILYSSPTHLIWAGTEAVFLFFVLSGFVLSLPFYSAKYSGYMPFLIKRIFRLYPPFFFTLLIALGGITLIPHGAIGGLSGWFNTLWADPIDFKSVLSHFSMIGHFNTELLDSPIWSLVVEMRISIIFPLIMFVVMKFNWKITIVIAAILTVMPYQLVKLGFGNEINAFVFTIAYIPMFIYGALLAKHLRVIMKFYSTIPTKGKVLLVLAAIFMFTCRFFPIHISFLRVPMINNTIETMGACLFVWFAVSSKVFAKILHIKPFVFMGKISYSFYLYHMVLLISITHLLYQYVNLPVIWLLSLSLSILIATLSFKFIEQPFMTLGRNVSLQLTNKNKGEEKIAQRLA